MSVWQGLGEERWVGATARRFPESSTPRRRRPRAIARLLAPPEHLADMDARRPATPEAEALGSNDNATSFSLSDRDRRRRRPTVNTSTHVLVMLVVSGLLPW
jgi:hypothetical protein